MREATKRVVGLVWCVALLSSVVAMPAAAQSDGNEFLVELETDGDADVSVTYAYDLRDDDEADAFETLTEDESVSAEFRERFEERMGAVAERSAERTDREMSVTDAEIDFERADGVGLVTLSVRWQGLAAADGEALTVTEPFASGFSPERPLVVSAPDGYEITTATPAPSSSEGSVTTWETGTDLGGFELTAERAETAAGTEPSDGDTEDAPGFGIGVAVAALLAAALLARRR